MREGSLHFAGVLNRSGGAFRTMDMDAFCAAATRIFGEHGHSLDCRLVEGAEVRAALKQAVNTRPDVLIAGGGDGTISTAAALAFQHQLPLAVVPAGTMNLFARALSLPLELEPALHAIATGAVRDVDIASANGRPFVQQYSVGLHTRLVRIRDGLPFRSRIGKIMATAAALALSLVRPPRFDVEVQLAGRVEHRVSSAVIVSNDPLPDQGLPEGSDLESGTLGLYLTEPLTFLGTLRLLRDIMLGRWRANREVTEEEVQRIVLRFPRRKSTAQATIDGELVPLEREVVLVCHPLGLRVIAPALAAPGQPTHPTDNEGGSAG